MPGILDILNVVGTIVDRVIPDPKDKMDLQAKLAEIADQEAQRGHDELMGQIEVDNTEATNPNMFVAGWRPFVGWGCGAALLYSTVAAPLFHTAVPDLSFLQTVLLAMLGIGGMRTVEKINGVDTATGTNAPAGQGAGQPTAPLAQPPRRKKFLGIF